MKKVYYYLLLIILLNQLGLAEEDIGNKPGAGRERWSEGTGLKAVNIDTMDDGIRKESISGKQRFPKSDSPFSFEEIKSAEKVFIPPVQYLTAGDGIKLAYRTYLPDEISAVLIFYHGAGAHSGLTYPHVGNGLCRNYNIAVYTPDMRGHGFSDGERGDAPSSDRVLEDIGDFIRYVRLKHPGKAIVLGGHSAGSGLILNYSDSNSPEKVDGYIFLSPYLGFRSKTDRENNPYPFATVKEELFVRHAMYGTDGHSKAVFYNYPEEIIDANPEMVTAISVNVSNAVTPTSPGLQLLNLEEPLAMWIGENDEEFDPNKVLAFIQSRKPRAETDILKDNNHLSIILNASEFIGPWIRSLSE